MTDARSSLRSLAKPVLRPLIDRLAALQTRVDALSARQDAQDAQLEQVAKAQDRLAAYQDRFTEEIHAAFGPLVETATGATAIVQALVGPGHESEAGLALRNELDHAVRRSQDLVDASVAELRAQIADLRSTTRLTQALLDRGVLHGPGGDAPSGSAAADEGEAPSAPIAAAPAPAPTRPAFRHPVPGFDLLYRAFEDRHRGDVETILDRQRDDYLDVLSALPNPELRIADLGCGRGELVRLLLDAGQPAVGVDSNLGQLVETDPGHFEQGDLFEWLDGKDDGSLRAVVSMHVVEHLPLDLQIRLVFESRRVLAPGGLLVLETPNALSLSVAASNFWVDPTHERPVHPLFLEFLAEQAGFATWESRPIHQMPVGFRGAERSPELVEDLDSLLLGRADLALFARR